MKNLLLPLRNRAAVRGILLLLFLVGGISSLWAQSPYSYTFINQIYNGSPQTKTLNGVDWTLTNNGGYYGYDSTKGQQIGSKKDPASSINWQTSGIAGQISEIKISTSGAKDTNAVISVKVNGVSYGSANLTTTNTEYTFTGSMAGTIEFNWTQTSSAAVYINKVEISYSTVPYTVQSGAWEDPATWSTNAVPLSSESATISAGHLVSLNQNTTRDAGTTTTINGTLAANHTYTNHGNTLVNGSFQLDAGGFADGQDFDYAGQGTLIFNNSSGFSVHSNHVFWPYDAAKRPFNVKILTGLVEFYLTERTVDGTFSTAGGFKYNGTGSTLYLNGEVYINTNGYFSDSPVYGPSSTLIYNTGGVYGRGNEWLDSNSGPGYPSSVIIRNNTTLNPNASGNRTNTFGLAKDLKTESGSSFYMDYGGSRSGKLTVGGNFENLGNFSLGNATGGDIEVKGNFTTNSSFDAKINKVILSGTTAQILSSNSYLYDLEVSNSTSIGLGSSLNLNRNLIFRNGKIEIGNYDLHLWSTNSNAISGYDNTKYVITNGNGQLKREVPEINLFFDFPVGNTSAYYLFRAKNLTTGTTNSVGIRVIAGNIPDAPDNNYTAHVYWKISTSVAGSLRVYPNWHAGDEGPDFNDPDFALQVGLYSGGTWTYVNNTKTGADPYTTGNYSDFSTGVLDGNPYFAVLKENTSPESYFRSKQSGNWTDKNTWEASSNGIVWKKSRITPGATAHSVVVQTGHDVNINSSSIEIHNTDVFGTLSVTEPDIEFKVQGSGKELRIKNGGVFYISNKTIKNVGNAKGLIETGGTFLVDGNNINSTNIAEQFISATHSTALWSFENGGICEWNSSNALASTGFPSYFSPASTGDLAIFRLSKDIQFGGSTDANTFNAIIEINSDKTLTLQGDKNKTFTGGVQGTGKLTISGTTSKFILGDSSTIPTLGNTGALEIIVPNNILEFPNGANNPATAQVTLKSNTGTENESFKNGGTDFSVSGVLDITNMRITNTNGTLQIKNGGKIRTSNSGGLAGTGSAIPSGTVSLATGSSVEYYGGNQSISNLPYYHLIFSGNGTKTPVASTSVDANGSVQILGNTTVDYSSKNLGSTASNNTSFTMTDGRLITGTTGTQPNMGGTYDLSGGVVEFSNSGATAQTIRNTPSHKYQNIEITGTNVGNSSGNIALRPNGTFKVKAGGIFTIRDKSIKCYDNSLTGNGAGTGCNVSVENNATLRTGNDKGFSGYDSAVGSSFSAVDANISDINLETGSTIEYLGEKSQDISLATNVGQGADGNYSNLKISGSLVNPVTGILHVKNMVTIDSHTNGATSYTGKLEIAGSADKAPANILYADKGITINAGNLILRNNALLMQDEDAVNTGNIEAEKTFTFSSERKQYNFIISPLAGQNIKSIYPGNPTAIYHSETKNYFYQSDGSYIPGRALALKEPPTTAVATTTYDAGFMGPPANGNIDYTLSYTTTYPDVTHGYNLVGNPYPSTLDLDLLYTQNSSEIESSFQFWDNRGNTLFTQQGSGYSGLHYAVYNAVSKTGSPAGVPVSFTVRIPNNAAKVGTGFMVRAKPEANGSLLKFRNSQRSVDYDGESFLGKNNPDLNRYWLSMITPDSLRLSTAVVYLENGNNMFAEDDTETQEASDNIYSLAGEKMLTIQGKAAFTTSDVISLGYNAFKAGNYTISLLKQEGIFANGQHVFLKDKLNYSLTDLLAGDYTFFTEPGSFTDRFEIVYLPEGTLGNAEITGNGIEVYRDGQDFVLRSRENMEYLEVYDISGRLVLQTKVGNKTYRLNALALAEGSYVLRIRQKQGITVKRILKN